MIVAGICRTAARSSSHAPAHCVSVEVLVALQVYGALCGEAGGNYNITLEEVVARMARAKVDIFSLHLSSPFIYLPSLSIFSLYLSSLFILV